MIISLSSFNMLHIDATLKSMDLMWTTHPTPYIPFIRNKDFQKKLLRDYDVIFDEPPTTDNQSMTITGLRIFTNPVQDIPSDMTVHLDISKKMIGEDSNVVDVVALSKQHDYYTKYYYNSCPIVHADNSIRIRYFCDTQSLIRINDELRYEKANEMYNEGRRIYIGKHLFTEYDSVSTNEVSYRWS